MSESGSKKIEITSDMMDHLSQLGLALQLTKNLKEEDSERLVKRRAHLSSHTQAGNILEKLTYKFNSYDKGACNIRWSECEQAYRMIELAIKHLESKRTKNKVEEVIEK